MADRMTNAVVASAPRFKKELDAYQYRVPLTNRARRQAKKRFRKLPHSQFPQGHRPLEYNQGGYVHPVPQAIIEQQRIIEFVSFELFKKLYRRLTSQQQTKVFDTLNDSKYHNDWLRAKGMKDDKKKPVQESVH